MSFLDYGYGVAEGLGVCVSVTSVVAPSLVGEGVAVLAGVVVPPVGEGVAVTNTAVAVAVDCGVDVGGRCVMNKNNRAIVG